jgi:hypothetical protein
VVKGSHLLPIFSIQDNLSYFEVQSLKANLMLLLAYRPHILNKFFWANGKAVTFE